MSDINGLMTDAELEEYGLICDVKPIVWQLIVPTGNGKASMVSFPDKESAVRNFLADPKDTILVSRVTVGYLTREDYAEYLKLKEREKNNGNND